ncbi:hypothetical protein HDZ31DRAFT_62240 [Schizophyllum fasciatum]
MPDHSSAQRYNHRTMESSGRVEVLGKSVLSLQADRDKLRLVLSRALAAAAQANSLLAAVHARYDHRTTESSRRVEVLGKSVLSLQADRNKLKLVLLPALLWRK